LLIVTKDTFRIQLAYLPDCFTAGDMSDIVIYLHVNTLIVIF